MNSRVKRVLAWLLAWLLAYGALVSGVVLGAQLVELIRHDEQRAEVWWTVRCGDDVCLDGRVKLSDLPTWAGGEQ